MHSKAGEMTAPTPVTDKIFIANEGSSNVTLIDGATNSTVTLFPH